MEEEKKEESVKASASEVEESSAPTEDKKSSNKNIVALVVVAVLILGALQFTGTLNLAGDPDIATVNGETIKKSEFDNRMAQILNSPQAQLLNLDDPEIRANVEDQILQEIINTRLLVRAAEEAGFATTDERIQTEYDLVVTQLGSEEALIKELATGGLTSEEFRKNIGDQLAITQYLESKINEDDIQATEEEVIEYYEQVALQEGAPPLSEIRTQVEAQISQQKQQELVGEILEELRAEATIEINE